MTDSPRRDGPEPTQPPGNSYPGYTDPAYASQASYGPPYQAPYVPPSTERLPAYSPYGNDPYATGQYGAQYPPGEPPQPPPEGPKSPRWLWVVAGIAVLMVIGLVIALVIVNSLGWVPRGAAHIAGELSRWCLVAAIAAIGMKTSLKELSVVGMRPVLLMALQTVALAGLVAALILLK